jgi:L-erythro-3,5-diaminohexanoate dehydrogenase
VSAGVPGSPYGLSRVLAPKGVLPQAAERLDPSLPLRPGEIEVRVSSLNLDSASFRQIVHAHNGDVDKMRRHVTDIVATRGKMQNLVTGSGGMLIGTIKSHEAALTSLQVGDQVATLVSLTATPLALEESLDRWDGQSEVIPVVARAIVFGESSLAAVPTDLPPGVALAAYDVCGAPALTTRVLQRRLLSGSAEHLVVLGGGKSAVLSAAAARELGIRATALVPTLSEAEALRARDLFDAVLVADATDPVAVRTALMTAGVLGDVTLVCVNATGCEHAALLATREGGAVVYFSMATDFAVVALGAEALVHDVEIFVGSGYVPGHAQLAMDLLRRNPQVLDFFTSREPRA